MYGIGYVVELIVLCLCVVPPLSHLSDKLMLLLI